MTLFVSLSVRNRVKDDSTEGATVSHPFMRGLVNLILKKKIHLMVWYDYESIISREEIEKNGQSDQIKDIFWQLLWCKNLPDVSVCACPIPDQIWNQNLNLLCPDSVIDSIMVCVSFQYKYIPQWLMCHMLSVQYQIKSESKCEFAIISCSISW